jgi:hypothetical protein
MISVIFAAFGFRRPYGRDKSLTKRRHASLHAKTRLPTDEGGDTSLAMSRRFSRSLPAIPQDGAQDGAEDGGPAAAGLLWMIR